MSERPEIEVPADFAWKCVVTSVDLSVAKGLLGEQEFYKTVLLDSHWTLEPHRPNPDDQEIDYLIHLPGNPANVLCWQVKTTFALLLDGSTRRAFFRIAMCMIEPSPLLPKTSSRPLPWEAASTPEAELPIVSFQPGSARRNRRKYLFQAFTGTYRPTWREVAVPRG